MKSGSMEFDPRARSPSDSNCYGQWVFDKDTASKKRHEACGPYESFWRDEIDTLPRPYKKIVAPCPCLPSIKSDCLKDSSKPKKLGPVYTRYTCAQHRRKEAGRRIEEQIHASVGLFNQFKDQVDPNKHRLLWEQLEKITSKDASREERQEGHDGLLMILDPSIGSGSPGSGTMSSGKGSTRSSTTTRDEKSKIDGDDIAAMIGVKQKNLYIYHAKPSRPARVEKAGLMPRKNKKKKEEEDNPWGNPEELALDKVLHDFTDWMSDLGGDYHIDEPTLRCLFSSGYDTTSTISVPIALMKDADLPVGLRQQQPGASSLSVAQSSSQKEHGARPKKKKSATERKNFRYGAWYLDPKTWTKVGKDEKVEDPKQLEMMQNNTGMDEIKSHLVEDLSQRHITRAFHEFVKRKGEREPDFVSEAMRLRREYEEREREKALAEERAKQEYQLKNIK